MTKFSRLMLAAFLPASLVGCGVVTPKMQMFSSDEREQGIEENRIINHIKCEIREGVRNALDHFSKDAGATGKSVDWLRNWGAKVTLELTVNEKSSFKPGVTFITPFNPREAFSFGLGVNLETEATRKELVSFSYSFRDLLQEPVNTNCVAEGGVGINSNLHIGQFILSKTLIAAVPGTIPGSSVSDERFPFSAFNYEATFVVTYGGSATPSWDLIRLSANQNGDLLAAARTSTQYVSLTLAEVVNSDERGVPAALDPRAVALHDATIIGQSVARALQNITLR
ncbi:hypothetical protein [Teichococcus deserti]|uniref:hypothetical protein n=1 Tax=Teichococcus deserti TaxID=1817963 RepID=UPI0010552F3D|nr:hypothetical protein [Pseudoroseomonas deserti]